MRNPAVVLPETMQAINGLFKAVHPAGLPKQTLELVASALIVLGQLSPACAAFGVCRSCFIGNQRRDPCVQPGDVESDLQRRAANRGVLVHREFRGVREHRRYKGSAS